MTANHWNTGHPVLRLLAERLRGHSHEELSRCNTTLSSLGLSSLQVLELLVATETELGVSLRGLERLVERGAPTVLGMMALYEEERALGLLRPIARSGNTTRNVGSSKGMQHVIDLV